MAQQVDILRGPSGSGKSTWILNKAGDDITMCVVSADHFFKQKDGTYKFQARLLGEAHADCMKHFLLALQEGYPYIVVDNTSTRVWEFENYVIAAECMGYDVRLVEFRPSKDQIPMLAKRNTHGVPEEAIARMVERFEDYKRFKVKHLQVEVR